MAAVAKASQNGTVVDAPVVMRTSKVRKAVFRKLNVAKYETIDIICDHEIEIEWKNIEQLLDKSKNVTTVVIKDYQATEAQVLTELNLAGYKAFAGDGVDVKTSPGKTATKQEFDRL